MKTVIMLDMSSRLVLQMCSRGQDLLGSCLLKNHPHNVLYTCGLRHILLLKDQIRKKWYYSKDRKLMLARVLQRTPKFTTSSTLASPPLLSRFQLFFTIPKSPVDCELQSLPKNPIYYGCQNTR